MRVYILYFWNCSRIQTLLCSPYSIADDAADDVLSQLCRATGMNKNKQHWHLLLAFTNRSHLLCILFSTCTIIIGVETLSAMATYRNCPRIFFMKPIDSSVVNHCHCFTDIFSATKWTWINQHWFFYQWTVIRFTCPIMTGGLLGMIYQNWHYYVTINCV